MKNQYFADVNDYRKYGLLRILAAAGGLSIAICWMLTEDDGRTDGKFVDYLDDPHRWRQYDPLLFDALLPCRTAEADRTIQWLEDKQLIPGAVYFSDLLIDNRLQRPSYFQAFHRTAADSDLVFFDPDNGIEVKSVPYGRKGSSKYVYWQELCDTFAAGHSILIYQHFARIRRDVFIGQLAADFHNHLGASEVISLSTARVLFLLVPQPRHKSYLAEKCAQIEADWKTQVKVRHDRYD